MNSYFPYRWSPASLTFNIYFYLILYLYTTRITINNGTPHLKSQKNPSRRAALGRPAVKITGGGGGGGGGLEPLKITGGVLNLLFTSFKWIKQNGDKDNDQELTNQIEHPTWSRGWLTCWNIFSGRCCHKADHMKHTKHLYWTTKVLQGSCVCALLSLRCFIEHTVEKP